MDMQDDTCCWDDDISHAAASPTAPPLQDHHSDVKVRLMACCAQLLQCMQQTHLTLAIPYPCPGGGADTATVAGS
jgi:hypothetical protein